jgi:hypothetical protein
VDQALRRRRADYGGLSEGVFENIQAAREYLNAWESLERQHLDLLATEMDTIAAVSNQNELARKESLS